MGVTCTYICMYNSTIDDTISYIFTSQKNTTKILKSSYFNHCMQLKRERKDTPALYEGLYTCSELFGLE